MRGPVFSRTRVQLPGYLEVTSNRFGNAARMPEMIATVGSNPRSTARDRARLVRFNAPELAVITQRARKCGRPVARYIRDCALGRPARAGRSPASDALIRQLSRVAARLIAAAALANEHHLGCASELEETVGDALDAIRQIE